MTGDSEDLCRYHLTGAFLTASRCQPSNSKLNGLLKSPKTDQAPLEKVHSIDFPGENQAIKSPNCLHRFDFQPLLPAAVAATSASYMNSPSGND